MSTPAFHRSRLEALAERKARLEREQQDLRNRMLSLESDAATTDRLLRRAAVEARNVLTTREVGRLIGRGHDTVASWIRKDLKDL